MVGLFDYPETPSHPPFTLSLQVNFADGSGGSQEFRFVGDEGIMTISGAGVGVSRRAPETEPGHTIDTFAEAQQKAFLEDYRRKYPEPDAGALSESGQTLHAPPRGYDDRREHFARFFHAMRTKGRATEDATFGYRAAAPALLCNQSYREGRTLGWDPEAMRAI
jgi:hypothetical protein